MNSLNRAAQRVLAFGAGLSMALVFVIIFLNALRRYTMGRSVPWGEELPIYLTIYGVMFGIALAYMQDRHIRFTVLTDMIANHTRERLFVAVDVITIISGIALSMAGHAFAMRRGHIDASGLKSAARWLADTTGIDTLLWVGKVGTWQYAIAIGGALLAIAALLRLIERLSSMRSI